ncbi:MAG: hypothetical protein OXT09_08055, partial [Myxococcales bacterium]|nr:hypothetical protein [Myxococcales bacterium]
PAPVARIKLRPAAQAPIGLAEDATVVELDSRRQRAEAPPEPEASEPPPLPEPIAVSEPAAREERAALPEIAPPAPEVVSSLAPAEVEKQQESERSSVGFVIAAVAAMAVIGVGGWWLTRGTYEPAPRAKTPIVKPPPAAAAAVAPKHAPPVAEQPAQPEAPVEQPAPVARKKVRKAKRAPKATRATAPAPAESEAQAPAEAPEPALQVKPRNTELPDTPSRDAVVAALSKVQRAVRACAPGQRGVAQVDLTVSGVGKVTHAIVGGDFAGTPEGSCIARAVRGARFTPFKQPRFRVVYPFSL